MLGLWNHHLCVIVVLFFNCHVVSHWLCHTIYVLLIGWAILGCFFHFGLLIIRLWWTLLYRFSLCRTEALISIGYNTIFNWFLSEELMVICHFKKHFYSFIALTFLLKSQALNLYYCSFEGKCFFLWLLLKWFWFWFLIVLLWYI